MLVVVTGTIVAFSSRTFTSTTDPWTTSPSVGVTIWTLAGLLGLAPGSEPEALVAEEHAAQSTRSTSHGTTGRRSAARRIGPHLRGAVGAEPEQVQPVRDTSEPRTLRDPVERSFERSLELLGNVHITHLAASRTDEVVVVADQDLGQLVPPELLVRHQPAHHPSLLERGEVPVDRALFETGAAREDVRDRHRAPRVGEQLDQSPTLRRVPLAGRTEPRRRGRVEVEAHPCSSRRSSNNASGYRTPRPRAACRGPRPAARSPRAHRAIAFRTGSARSATRSSIASRYTAAVVVGASASRAYARARSPIAARPSGSPADRSMTAASCSGSGRPGPIRTTTSSGTSRYVPTPLTIVGVPTWRARTREPLDSPRCGYRRFTRTSKALSHARNSLSATSAKTLTRPPTPASRIAASTSHPPRRPTRTSRTVDRTCASASRSCGIPFVALRSPATPTTTSSGPATPARSS